MNSAFFRVKHGDTEELHPEPRANSGWGADQMRGPAVSAALAREVERTLAKLNRPDLQAVRWTLDLFRAVRMRPSVTSATVVREGPRLCLIDAVVSQDGEPRARASVLFLRTSEAAPGQVWSGGTSPAPPPAGLVPVGDHTSPYTSSIRPPVADAVPSRSNPPRKLPAGEFATLSRREGPRSGSLRHR